MNNPLDRIQSYFDELTKTDKEIAIYIINNPNNVVTTSLDDIVKNTSSSKSALSRFAQRIGYSGFSEFRYDMARFLVSHDAEDKKEGHDPVKTITETYASYITHMADVINREQVDRIAGLISSTTNVKLIGLNRSYNSANQLKQRLARVGYSNVSSESDRVVIDDYLEIADAKDVFVIFSTRDNSKFFTSRMKNVYEKGSKVVFITCNPSLPFKKQCYEYVVLPRISKDSYASFLDDQAIFFVFIEILIEAIVRKSQK